MKLNSFAAEKRMAIFHELTRGERPSIGAFSEAIFLDAKDKAEPQIGATRFESHQIVFEFIYPAKAGAAILLEVALETPERVVFMPVPEWVLESIWQGEIDGSYHFESDCNALMERFAARLEPEANQLEFGSRIKVGRV